MHRRRYCAATTAVYAVIRMILLQALKEIIKYYEANNAEIISVLERPLIEAAVTTQYLLANDDVVIEDYRKCWYKDRLRLLHDLQEGSPFFDTKAGKRLLASVQRKMAFENLTPAAFETQKRNRWRLQGKTFFQIFSEVIGKEWGAALYPSTYGMMSDPSMARGTSRWTTASHRTPTGRSRPIPSTSRKCVTSAGVHAA
jgi:hypothetical protein